MTPLTIGVIGFVALLVLLAIRVPVGLAMIAVALCGLTYLTNFDAATARLGQDAFREGSVYSLSIIPMFVLMGMVLAKCGLAVDLFRAMARLLWRVPGALALVAVLASALFGAVNGSSVAGATTMATIAVPEMKRHNYDEGFAAAATAAGSTLGTLIPPSAVLVIYGLLTELPIGELLVAAIIPGIVTVLALMLAAYLQVRRHPSFAPDVPTEAPPGRRRDALLLIWPVPVLFGISMGGLYVGLFTATEAGAVGAFLALVYAVASRRLTWPKFVESVSESVRITSMVFLLLIAGRMFGYFLATSRVVSEIGESVASLSVPPFMIVLFIFVIYFILGALMDEASILVIMSPLMLPVVVGIGYDPIWFGVLTTMMLLTGLLMPPVGLICFVVSGVTGVPLRDVSRRVLPFVAAISVAILALVLVPDMALVLL